MLYLIKSLIRKVILFGLLVFIAFNAHANSPVKSVDADGNVTYSDQPISNAKTVSKVEIQAGPSTADINAAQQQANKNIDAAKNIDQKNAQALNKQQSNRKPAQSGSIQQPDTIYTGRAAPPIYARPKPKPPIKLPGTHPPRPSHPIARPRSAR